MKTSSGKRPAITNRSGDRSRRELLAAAMGAGAAILSGRRTGSGTNRVWPELTNGFFHAVAGENLADLGIGESHGAPFGGNYGRIFDKVTAAKG